MSHKKSTDLSSKAQALFAALDQHVADAANAPSSARPKPIGLARSKE